MARKKSLRDLGDTDLLERFNDSKEELFNLRFQLATGQFDNASITMKEINTIRDAFKRFIRGVYHVRISYPEVD